MKDKHLEKDLKESVNILNDLNLIFEHMNKNGGKYLAFLGAAIVKDGDTFPAYTVIDNLTPEEALEITYVFIAYLKENSSDSKCDCDKCKKAKLTLSKIIKSVEKISSSGFTTN